MDLEGRRTSYSIARVLEEVQEQKTKEQQLQRQSQLLLNDNSGEASSEFAYQPTVTGSAGCPVETPAAEEELQFQPGFVSQLLGKFGGQTSGQNSGHLRKATSVQNLAGPAAPEASFGGIQLRHPPSGRIQLAGNQAVTAVVRRCSQDATDGTRITKETINGTVLLSSGGANNGPPVAASPANPGAGKPPTPLGGGAGRVLIIPKNPPPVVKRLQQQQHYQQQQQQQQYQQQQQQQQQQQYQEQQQQKIQKNTPSEPVKSPNSIQKSDDSETGQTAGLKSLESTENFVNIPSDESLPIKNIVQAKRSLFEQPNQPASRGFNGPSLATVAKTSPYQQNNSHSQRQTHQPVIGRSTAPSSTAASPLSSAGSTKQIIPRPVEIVNRVPQKVPDSNPVVTVKLPPPVPAAQKPIATILPSRQTVPIATPAQTPVNKQFPPSPTKQSQSTPFALSTETSTDSDSYGFGLPVPKLKSAMPFNGQNLKRVELNERAVVAMRKAGKSWFFGTDVAAAPEGSIAVKLTPNNRPFSLTEDGDDHQHDDADELTEERRAQTTVWDHVRNADSGRQRVDASLAAEAKRLMASADTDEVGVEAQSGHAVSGGGSGAGASIAARRNKKVLCFKRDSVLEETYEYQSEQSLIEELRIVPDYPTDPFEPSDSPTSPTLDESDEDEAERLAKKANNEMDIADGGQNSEASSTGIVARIPAGIASTVASYQPKLADEFVWGATTRHSGLLDDQQQQQQKTDSSIVAVNSLDSTGPVDDPDAQWSSSATTDLLF